MKTEQTQSGCVDAFLVGHVDSRFTTSFMVMLNLLLQVRKAQIKLQMERERTMHLLLQKARTQRRRNLRKKDKSSKEPKEAQDQANGLEEAAVAEPDEDTTSVDVKERIKKVAFMKKKKSSKEMDAAAKIAASEAAARSARLAAAMKKEKSHYNQQPVR